MDSRFNMNNIYVGDTVVANSPYLIAYLQDMNLKLNVEVIKVLELGVEVRVEGHKHNCFIPYGDIIGVIEW